MKKIFLAIIPAFLIAFVIIYSSCNDMPVETASNENVESTPTESSDINSTLKDAVQPESEVTDKINSELKSDKESGEPGDASDLCTFVTLSPSDTTVYVLTGTNFIWNYHSKASIGAQTSERHHIIYKNGVPIENVDNWYTGFCGPGLPPVQNNVYRSLSLAAGDYTIGAKVVYWAGGNYYDYLWAYATVHVIPMNLRLFHQRLLELW